MNIPTEVTDLISGSGNNFHAKVARWFQDNGWHITVSPYYMDQTQGKAREIDLIAERSWQVKDMFGNYKSDIVVRLFVECKFVPSYAVFWLADKNLSEASRMVCANGIFREDNFYTKKHHYLACSPRVAKLFTSSAQKGAELEPFYKALNQSLNAMVSMRGKPTLIPEIQKRDWSTKTILEYPIVVFSSFERFWSVDFYSESEPAQIKDNFQLEVRYAYSLPV